MQSSIQKLLLIFVLCVASHAKAETKVTVLDFTSNVPGNDVVGSMSADLENNLINSVINVKKSCPGSVEMEVRTYQGDNLVNQVNQKLDKPIKDFEKYNLCEEIESPEVEDDSCSIMDGDHSAKNCDVGSLFKDMQPGEYKAECDFVQLGEIIASVVVKVKVDKE